MQFSDFTQSGSFTSDSETELGIKHLISNKISLGPEMYFTSQSIIILNNLLDKNI